MVGRCSQAPGDTAKACHVDCSISGADACPADYACTQVTEGAQVRKLCLPNGKVCNDALGGFCDRNPLPQSCSRSNDAGVCNGQRQCLATGRYDKCGAASPQYKNSCQDQDPAGCTLKFSLAATSTKQNCGMCGKSCGASEDCCNQVCTSVVTTNNCGVCGKACVAGQGCCNGSCTALNTVANCGACGNACPGQNLSTNDVTCADPAAKRCDMTCRGDNYDVNKVPDDGCERLDVVPPGHTQQTAASRGSKGCNDGASSDNFSAQVLSDGRVHQNPAVVSFSGTVGSAPDFWVVHGDGGLSCVNDYDVTFTTSGGGATVCYRMTITTNLRSDTIDVSGAGSGQKKAGAFLNSAYNDNTDIYFKIEKTCNLPVQEAVNYTVSYHL